LRRKKPHRARGSAGLPLNEVDMLVQPAGLPNVGEVEGMVAVERKPAKGVLGEGMHGAQPVVL